MRDAVIVEAVRTPVGKRNGSLSAVHPIDLVGPRAAGADRAHRPRPRPRRRRDLGVRLADRRADHGHRPQRRARRGLADVGARSHHRPAVRFLPAGRAFRRGRTDRRAVRRRRRRWCRVHVPDPDGQHPGRRREPVHRAGLDRSVRRRHSAPGRRRGDGGEALESVPSAAGRIQPRLPREGRCGAGFRPDGGTDRAGARRVDRRLGSVGGRGGTPRRHPGSTERAASRLRRGRRGHRGEFESDLRRLSSTADDDLGTRCAAWPPAAGTHPHCGARRRRPGDHADRPAAGYPKGPGAQRLTS